MDLGLEQAGFECAFQVEKDPFRRAVLEKHWPELPRFDDVTTFGRGSIDGTTIDLLAGGWPCQPHSLNGTRQASEDERDRWPDFYRVICEFMPRWIVAENVPGVLSSENGRYFGRVLRDLASVGYDAEWDVLSAYAFGAPHKRERLFLVAYPKQEGRARVLCGDLPGFIRPYPLWQTHSPMDAVWMRLSSLEESLGQPAVFGSDDGAAYRVDRLAAVGEAVVPVITEWIGRLIISQLYD